MGKMGTGVSLDKRTGWAFIQADATRLPFADKTFDLVFGSPPYIDCRTYGIGAQRKCEEWIEWMLTVTTEAQRVCKGPVVWVAAGGHRKRNYQPACEGLMYLWWKRGGDCQLYRPCYWHRVGIPGSGGDDWFRADVEYVMCFKRPGALPWADNTAMGHPPKWGPGGEMSHRLASGARVNQWGKNGSRKGMGARKADGTFADCNRPSHVDYIGGVPVDPFGFDGKYVRARAGRGRFSVEKGIGETTGQPICGKSRRANGEMKNNGYPPPVLANPGNLVKVIVGGGVMGHPYASENEAPFPSNLARWFIKSLCPPGGKVLDPFSGSGTTVEAAVQEGREGVGSDLRASQCELGTRRLKNPYAKKTKRKESSKTEGMLWEEGVGNG